MATLNPKELDPVYQTVSHEEAVAIANLGAQVYVAMKDRLYETWASSMVGDEASKAEIWRQEGRQAMLESMKSKLVAAEKLQEQLTLIEVSREADHQRADQRLRYETELLKKEIADIQQQHCQSMESEVGRRLAGAVRVAEDRKDQEAASLRLRIAALTEETQNQAMLSLNSLLIYGCPAGGPIQPLTPHPCPPPLWPWPRRCWPPSPPLAPTPSLARWRSDFF